MEAINIQVNGETYNMPFPTQEQYNSITFYIKLHSNGGQLIADNSYAALAIPSLAILEVMLPGLRQKMGVERLTLLPVQELKKLVAIVGNKYLPLFNQHVEKSKLEIKRHVLIDLSELDTKILNYFNSANNMGKLIDEGYEDMLVDRVLDIFSGNPYGIIHSVVNRLSNGAMPGFPERFYGSINNFGCMTYIKPQAQN